MTDPVKFTVLMAVYDGDDPEVFGDAIQSVFANDRQPDDFVLVVDGPVRVALKNAIDDTTTKHPIRPIWLDKNGGLAKALNAGLKEIKTEWVARADADDSNLPNRFSKQIAFLTDQGNNLDVFSGAIVETDESGNEIGTRQLPQTPEEIARFGQRRNPFNHMCVMFRTEIIRQAGGYPDMKLREDYALWAKLLAKGARAANMSDVLVKARAGGAMLQRRGGWSYALNEYRFQKYLIEIGFKPVWAAGRDFILRASVFLAPGFVRRFVYATFLRM